MRFARFDLPARRVGGEGGEVTPAEKVAAAKRPKPRQCRTPIQDRYGRAYLWVCTIRRHRQRLGLSLRDVATGGGLSIAGLCEIERGTDPQLTTARRLAHFFGASVEKLWPRLAPLSARKTHLPPPPAAR